MFRKVTLLFFLIAISIFLVSKFFSFPASAQVCNGFTDSGCSNTAASCNTARNRTLWTCDPTQYPGCYFGTGNCPCTQEVVRVETSTCTTNTQSDSGYACKFGYVPTNPNVCSSCVQADQNCDTGGTEYWDDNGNTYWTSCSIIDTDPYSGCGGSGSGLKLCGSGCNYQPACNGGIACGGWSACGGYPANTCYPGNGSQSRSCTYTTYNGSPSCIQTAAPTEYQSCTVSNCSANYSPSGNCNCVTAINVHAFIDYNDNGVIDSGDVGLAGVTVTDNGGNYPVTDSNGNTDFPGKVTGSYTISLTALPTGYQASTATSVGVNLTNSSGNPTVYFGAVPRVISGNVFTDYNNDGIKDGSDINSSGVTVDDGVTSTTTDANGNYYFGCSYGSCLGNASYTVTVHVPNGYQTYGASSTTVSPNPFASANFIIVPRVISGNVYADLNHDNSKNYNDFFASGIVVSDGVTTTTTDGSGNYYFGCSYGSCLGNASYTVSVVFNGNWSTYTSSPGTSNAQSVSPSPFAGANFIVTPQYQIGGYLYYDKDQDALYDHSDTALSGFNVNVNGTNYVTDSTGHFASSRNLISGKYTASYTLTSTQANTLYKYTTPSSRAINLGQSTQAGYSASGNGDTEVLLNNPTAGDVDHVNFGINNDNQTKQGICSDTRNDNNSGLYYEPLPASYSCGGINQNYADIQNGNCSNGAGIIYSCDGLFNFGLGSAGNPSWTAGGTTAECFNPVNPKTFRSSYEYLLQTAKSSDITITDLSRVCNTQDCQLPSSLTPGVYQTTSADTNNGDLHLNLSSALPGPDTSKPGYTPYGYIILVYGDLYLENNVIVPNGTVLAFGVQGNINVAANVGNGVNSSTVGTSSVNTTNLEGLYSADNNFIIHSYSETNGGQKCNNDGSSLDKKLDVVGSIITGANDGGGSLVNNRDLCSFDQECPTLSYGDGLNTDAGNLAQQLINSIAIGYLSHQVYSQHEVAP